MESQTLVFITSCILSIAIAPIMVLRLHHLTTYHFSIFDTEKLWWTETYPKLLETKTYTVINHCHWPRERQLFLWSGDHDIVYVISWAYWTIGYITSVHASPPLNLKGNKSQNPRTNWYFFMSKTQRNGFNLQMHLFWSSLFCKYSLK